MRTLGANRPPLCLAPKSQQAGRDWTQADAVQSALHILLTSILQIEQPRIVQATKEQRVGAVCVEPIWAANVESGWSTAALHRIPPGADAAHALVIAVDHLQRYVGRLGSRHRRVIRRRWSVT